MTTKVKTVLAQLQSLGNTQLRARSARYGASDGQFSVPLGEIRKLAAEIKPDHALAVDLWNTGITDAQLLAILLFKPKQLSSDDLDRMVRSIHIVQVADWLAANVIKKHPDKILLCQRWMNDANPWVARAGWSLTSEQITKQSGGLDLVALLDRIEAEMEAADPEVQWTMNFCLAGIGIYSSEHRKRAITIRERLGLYRDYPVSKGCTSPFSPIWINEMVEAPDLMGY